MVRPSRNTQGITGGNGGEVAIVWWRSTISATTLSTISQNQEAPTDQSDLALLEPAVIFDVAEDGRRILDALRQRRLH